MIAAIKMHIVGIKVAISSRMAYRGDLAISFFIMLFVELLMPMITILIYRNGASFPGWNVYEVLLIQSIFLISRGIAFPLFFGLVWNTLARVREGTLELILIKPVPILQMLILTEFDCEDLGKLLGGICIFTISILNLPHQSLSHWLQFLLLLFLSIVVLFCFSLILAGLTIVWVGNSRVFEIFSSICNFGMYPLGIFSKTLQTAITIIIPIAMLGFFPAAVLLGRPSGGMAVSAAACILFLIGSLAFWNVMLRKYTSAGG